MSDVSLVPVDHQPDFEDVSLVPVDHDPFSDDGVTPQAQSQPAQTQPAQPPPQQPATGVDRLYVSPPAKDPRASEPSPSTAATPPPLASMQVRSDGISQATPSSGPTSNVVTPQQVLQGAINQFYPGAQFAGLAQQAYKNGQYGNAIGYGVSAVADSLLAATGGKLLGAGIAAGVGALRGVALAGTRGARSAVGIGEHAGESIAARSAARDFTAAERAEINRIGSHTGCHTCGTRTPGTKSGNFVLDHQPASALNPSGGPQRLLPHCIDCSREQGLEIARRLSKGNP